MREEDESRDGAIATRVSPTCERVMVDARSVVLLGLTGETTSAFGFFFFLLKKFVLNV